MHSSSLTHTLTYVHKVLLSLSLLSIHHSVFIHNIIVVEWKIYTCINKNPRYDFYDSRTLSQRHKKYIHNKYKEFSNEEGRKEGRWGMRKNFSFRFEILFYFIFSHRNLTWTRKRSLYVTLMANWILKK